MSGGYEFYGTRETKLVETKEKIKTVIIKLKGETYSIKIHPLTKTKAVTNNNYEDEISIPIEITNDNIHRNYNVEATEEHNENDTADCLMDIFKKQVIKYIKEFNKEKRTIKVMNDFNSKLDNFTLTEEEVALEEL